MSILTFISNYKLHFVVGVGVLMTLVSAVITNNLLEKNNILISSINSDSLKIERQIDDRWQFLQESKRKLDLAVSVLASKQNRTQKDNIIINQYFYNQFKNISIGEEEISRNATIYDYISLVEKLKRQTIDAIDFLYIEKINFDDQKNEILANNMLLKNLALFFQILGLILVLSKGF